MLCNTCQFSKSHRLPYSSTDSRSSNVLELVYCDLWGPLPVKPKFGIHVLCITDDYSRFTWLYPLKLKSNFFNTFVQFQQFVENQHSARIKKFQSDGGAGYTNNCFKSHLSKFGIHHQLSCPYTLSQNGRAERKHHFLELSPYLK